MKIAELSAKVFDRRGEYRVTVAESLRNDGDVEQKRFYVILTCLWDSADADENGVVDDYYVQAENIQSALEKVLTNFALVSAF